MLRNTADYFRILAEEFEITLFRGVTYSGEKQLLVGVETLREEALIKVPGVSIPFEQSPDSLPFHGNEAAPLYALKRKKAGRAVVQAVKRRHRTSREKELERDVPAVIVERKSQTSAAYEIKPSGDLPFFKNDSLGPTVTSVSSSSPIFPSRIREYTSSNISTFRNT